MAGFAFLLILAMIVVAFVVGRTTAKSFKPSADAPVHSLPVYHGAFVAAWVGIPAFILVLLWLFLQGTVVDRLILGSLPPIEGDDRVDPHVRAARARGARAGGLELQRQDLVEIDLELSDRFSGRSFSNRRHFWDLQLH